MMTKLKEVGFQTTETYAEGHCHFFAPWQFLVAFKNIHTSENWFRGEAEVELLLHQRLHRTKSGKPILQYFDGHVMKDYQVSHKVITSNNCRSKDEGSALKCSELKTTTMGRPASLWDGLFSLLRIHRMDIDSKVDGATGSEFPSLKPPMHLLPFHGWSDHVVTID